MGAPQVTRSTATPVGNAVSSEIRGIGWGFHGFCARWRDSVTKLREIQANFSTTEVRSRGVEMKLCEFKFRMGVDEVKLRAVAVECQYRER